MGEMISENQPFHVERLPYGKGTIDVRIPLKNFAADQAIEMVLVKQGEGAEIVLMKNGSDIIPRFAGK